MDERVKGIAQIDGYSYATVKSYIKYYLPRITSAERWKAKLGRMLGAKPAARGAESSEQAAGATASPSSPADHNKQSVEQADEPGIPETTAQPQCIDTLEQRSKPQGQGSTAATKRLHRSMPIVSTMNPTHPGMHGR